MDLSLNFLYLEGSFIQVVRLYLRVFFQLLLVFSPAIVDQ